MNDGQAVFNSLLEMHGAYHDAVLGQRGAVMRAIEAKQREVAEAEKCTRKDAGAVSKEVKARRDEIRRIKGSVPRIDGTKDEREAAARHFPALAPLLLAAEQAAQALQEWVDREKQAIDELGDPYARLKRLKKELYDLRGDLELLDGLLGNPAAAPHSVEAPGPASSSPPEEGLEGRQQVEEARAHFERRSLDSHHLPPGADSQPEQPLLPPTHAFIDAYDLQARAIDWRLAGLDATPSAPGEEERTALAVRAGSLGVVAWALAGDAFGLTAPELERFRDWYRTAHEAARLAFYEVRADPSLRHLLHGSCQTVATCLSALITLERHHPGFNDHFVHDGFNELRRLLSEEWPGVCRHMNPGDPADPLTELEETRRGLRGLQAKVAERASCECVLPAGRLAKPPKGGLAPRERRPRTARSMLQEARTRFSDDLIFGDDVGIGVDELRDNAGPPSKILRVLNGLARISRGLREDQTALPLRDWVKRHCPVQVGDESSLLKNSKKPLRARTWHDGHEPRPFTLHAKVNESTHPDQCVRIYFDWCKARERIVIGWIGRHP